MDKSKIYTAEMALRQVVQKVFGLGDKDIFEEDEQKYLEDIRNLILCIWVYKWKEQAWRACSFFVMCFGRVLKGER